MAEFSSHPISRNSPCPCGSGKRYKACHGSQMASSPQPAHPAASSSALPEARQVQDGSIVVLCRRAVDWSAPNYADRRSRFNQAHPLRRLARQWQEHNPGIDLYEYRRSLHQVARRTWEATGAQVVLNRVPVDRDDDIPSETLRELRRAEWIIPIDDDDWLAPDIITALTTTSTAAVAAIWESVPLYLQRERCVAKDASPYRSSGVPTSERMVLSCAYALHRSGAACLTDRGLFQVLVSHAIASRFLLNSALPVRDVGAIGSIHLRHQATALSATFDEDRTLGDFVIPDEIAYRVPWAIEPLRECKGLHRSLAGRAQQVCAGSVAAAPTALSPQDVSSA